jgi:drug/metabolite transporter (DMT)-like permease
MESQPEPRQTADRAFFSLSLLLLLATSLIWGTSFILIKKAGSVFSPVEIGTLRIVYAFVAFIPVFLNQRHKIPKGVWTWLLVSGLMGSLFPSLLFSWAGSKIQSSLSGMLNAVTPLFTVLAGTLFFQQRFAISKWFGLLVGLLGALVLGFMKPGGHLSFNIYILPVILATLFYALNVNLLKIKFNEVPPLLLSSATIVAIGPIAATLLFGFTNFTHKMTHTPGAWEAAGFVAILGLFGTAVALVLFNKLIQISGPLTASSVTYIMPVVSVLWGLADGEPFGMVQAAGLGGILIGVYLVNRKKD